MIPDIYHAGRDFYTFWFCNTFSLPVPAPLATLRGAELRVWLHLRGVNYSFR